jgi:hypothetical protein
MHGRWIKYGGANTKKKITGLVATERRRRNYVASITKADANIAEDHDGKAHKLFQAYNLRLGISDAHELKFDLAPLFTPLPGLSSISSPFSK